MAASSVASAASDNAPCRIPPERSSVPRLLSPEVFSKHLTLRYGGARPGVNPEILSFRVSLREPPETNRILGDPRCLFARPVLSASSRNPLTKGETYETL